MFLHVISYITRDFGTYGTARASWTHAPACDLFRAGRSGDRLRIVAFLTPNRIKDLLQ